MARRRKSRRPARRRGGSCKFETVNAPEGGTVSRCFCKKKGRKLFAKDSRCRRGKARW